MPPRCSRRLAHLTASPRSTAANAGAAPVEQWRGKGSALRALKTESAHDASSPDAPAELPPKYRFVAHNRAVRQKIENCLTRVRRHGLADLDEAFYQFYAERIRNVSSRQELDRLLRDRPEPPFLCASETELIGDAAVSYDCEAFPDGRSNRPRWNQRKNR